MLCIIIIIIMVAPRHKDIKRGSFQKGQVVFITSLIYYFYHKVGSLVEHFHPRLQYG